MRDLSAVAIASSLAAATCLGAARLYYGVHGLGAQVFGPSISRGPGLRRSIALTFDDGPSPGSTSIARFLAAEGVQATFFQCGANVLRHPEIAKGLAAAGHEIGNHTFSHARLSPRLGWQPNFLSSERIFKEFAKAQEIIIQHTGAVPKFLRAPYGLRWRGLHEVHRRLDLMGVMWTTIGHDWEWNADRVAEHVLRQAVAGGIVCLHDGRETRVNPDTTVTLDALRVVIPRLKRMGFAFETISSLTAPAIEGLREIERAA